YPFSSGGLYANVEITFTGGEYEIDNINLNTGNSELDLSLIFKLQQSVSPVKRLSFNDITFKGITTGNVFNTNAVTRADLIEFNDTTIDIKKVDNNGIELPSSNLTVLGDYNNNDNNADVIFNNSKIRGRVLVFAGESNPSSNNSVKTFRSTYLSEISLGDPYTSFHIQSSGIMDGTSFITVDNIYAYNESSYYDSNGGSFKEIVN